MTGTTTLAAGAANNITLNNAANNFSTVGITSGNNVALTDVNALILGASTVSGTLGVTTAGALTQSGPLTVTGVTTLAAGAANNITLNNAANNFSTVGITSGNNVALTDVNALILGASTVSGTLGVTTAGALTQSGPLTVTGTTTLAAGAANNITLNNAANNFSTVGITTGNNVLLTDANALILGASTVSGTLGRDHRRPPHPEWPAHRGRGPRPSPPAPPTTSPSITPPTTSARSASPVATSSHWWMPMLWTSVLPRSAETCS